MIMFELYFSDILLCFVGSMIGKKKNCVSCLLYTCRWFACWLNSFKGMNYLSYTSVSFPHLLPDKSLSCDCNVIVMVYFNFKVLCQNMWMYWTAVNHQVEALCPPVCSTSCRLLSPHQPYSVQVCPRVTLQGTLSQGRYMYRECEIVGEGMEVRVIKIEHGM